MNQIDTSKIRETAAKIKAKVGTLRLYGQLTAGDAEAILKDADIIMQEVA